MAEISTLVQDIYDLLKGGSVLEHLETFKDNLDSITRKRFERVLEKRAPKLYLSAIGKPSRQIWYELKGYEGEPLQPASLLRFYYGDLCEALLLFLIKQSGHKVESPQEKVELDGISGRIDVIVDNVLIDIKSCSKIAFNKFVTGKIRTEDPFGYVGQLASYLEAIKVEVNGAGFLAINKENGEICFCPFTLKELHDYKPRNKIREIREDLSQDTPPKRCYDAVPLSKKKEDSPTILALGCSWCPWKYECWKDSNNGTGLIKKDYSYNTVYFVDVKNHRFKKETPEDEFPTKED